MTRSRTRGRPRLLPIDRPPGISGYSLSPGSLYAPPSKRNQRFQSETTAEGSPQQPMRATRRSPSPACSHGAPRERLRCHQTPQLYVGPGAPAPDRPPSDSQSLVVLPSAHRHPSVRSAQMKTLHTVPLVRCTGRETYSLVTPSRRRTDETAYTLGQKR